MIIKSILKKTTKPTRYDISKIIWLIKVIFCKYLYPCIRTEKSPSDKLKTEFLSVCSIYV